MSRTIVSAINRGTFKLADWTLMPQRGKQSQSLPLESEEEEGGGCPQLFFTIPNYNPESDASLAKVKEHDLATQLAAAIKSVAHDLRSDKPKRYTYEEWTRFTTLIRFSRRQNLTSSHAENEDTSSTRSGSGSNSSSDDEEHLVEWDWIGEDSPMLADITEAEWVLDRLCESLNRYTKRQAEKVCFFLSLLLSFSSSLSGKGDS